MYSLTRKIGKNKIFRKEWNIDVHYPVLYFYQNRLRFSEYEGGKKEFFQKK